MVKKVKAVIALLETNGWKYARTKGGHWIYRKGNLVQFLYLEILMTI